MASLSLKETESEARRHLDPAVYDFIAGGADDEITLRANEAAFARIGLVPRVLRGSGAPKLDSTLLGCQASMPVIIAPTAFHRLVHPDGERATARAAAATRTILTVSMASTVAIEQVAGAAREVDPEASLWFQLYLQPDLGFTEALIRRAEAAGCSALVVTVDSAAFGRRERDLRNGLRELPEGMRCENLGESGRPRQIVFSPELCWEHFDWLRKTTALKIVLKGVVHPEDAKIAVRRGANGLQVSNHGGRQLDSIPATIDLLPAVVEAVGGSVPVIVDGGIRRGTDVVKALALGASAVAIGRPVLWGLAADGEAGVSRVLEMLRAELAQALVLCGCRNQRELTRDLLHFRSVDGRW
jgi:4-hydroxymandelate oxidase